ncbi:MAG: helix-turn-helix domain-containing protein [Prevotella sp.]|nr:helix-turn-helix domain-containing protein [Prevotella sp.]
MEENLFIQVFRFEDIGENPLFDNYQRYDFYQLLWLTKIGGDPSYFLDFNEYMLEDDQIILIFPGQIDKLDIRGKEGFLYTIHNDIFFHINHHIKSDYLNGFHSNPFLRPDKETKEILGKLNDLILGEYNSLNRIVLMNSYMEAFLFHVSSLFEKSEPAYNKNDSLIAELMRLIDKCFITQRETDFYANEFGMTPKSINEACKKGTGKTIKQHLQERLVLEIKKEIRLNKKSLKEIAFDLGFNEAAYFTRFFKQHTSLTPTQFRDS